MENDQVCAGGPPKVFIVFLTRIRFLGCSRRSLRPPQVLSDQCVWNPLNFGWTVVLIAFQDRLITSKDHASVQINIVDVDANGRALNTSTTFALCGQVRSQGEGDDSINRLATKAGCESQMFYLALVLLTFSVVLRNVWSYQK